MGRFLLQPEHESLSRSEPSGLLAREPRHAPPSSLEHETQTLDEPVQESKEPAFNFDFSKVRIHHAEPQARTQTPVLQMEAEPEEELGDVVGGVVELLAAGDDEEPPGTGGTVLQQQAISQPVDQSGLLRRGQATVAAAHQSLPHAEPIQRSFGHHDLSRVKSVVGGPASAAASAMGARAFTTGERIAFRDSPDLHLAAHEAAHIVQQRKGVLLPEGVGRPGDPYEKLANQVADAVVAGRSAQSLLDGGIGASSSAAQSPTPSALPAPGVLQMEGPNPKPKKTYVRRLVVVTQTVDQEGFKQLALQSLFGSAVPPSLKWKLSRVSYGPNDSPVTLWVDVSLIKAYRAFTNLGKGLPVGESGEIEGAQQRARTFLAGKPTKTKAELMAEIDRRYSEATGSTQRIKRGEQGNIQLWNQIRDEVLFQNEYIQNLPPQVKKLIKESTNGRRITAKDIEQLFRIAKKIEGMEPGDVADYHSRVQGTTTDLDAFESSVEGYLAQKKHREEEQERREQIQTKLYGNEDLYQKYKRWKELKGIHVPSVDEFGVYDPNARLLREAKASAERELLAALSKAGFGSIASFEKYIADFLFAFEKEAQRIAIDILEKYEGLLFREGERYKEPRALNALYAQLGTFRSKYREFEKYAAISNARAEYDKTPGSIVTKGPPPVTLDKAREALPKAESAKQAASAEIGALSGKHPLFKEEHLPLNRRLDKQKMATSAPAGLRTLITEHVAARKKDAGEAKSRILGDQEVIYKLHRLMPEFYEKMGIPPGKILDQIIQDKIARIKRDKLIVNAILTVLAIALAIISYGAATPLVAAVAAGGGLAISSYFAYEEYQEYVTQKDLADVGFAKDPSMIWLVVAIAGAVLDMGAAYKAMQAVSKAATTLKISEDFNEFVRAIRKLQDAGAIDAKIAQSIEKAALARAAGKEASGEIVKLLQLKGVARTLTNPEAYKALVRLASAQLKRGVHSFHHFVLEIQKARKIAKVASDLSPEELAKAKEAWEQAVRLHKSAEVPLDILNEGKVFGRFSNGSHLEIVSRSKLYGGNKIKLDPNRTTTVTGVLRDTGTVARRGEKMAGATAMGANPGGINILRSPKWAEIQLKYKALDDAGETLKYWQKVTDEFWDVANKPWLDEAIKRGDGFRFVSNPTDAKAIYVTNKQGEFILDTAGNKMDSIFGREVKYLQSKGYTFLPDGTAVPPR